jgi:hypothetical protein
MGTGVLYQWYSSLGMKLTTYLNPAQRLSMSGATPLLPSMPSWCGQGKLYLLTQIFINSSQKPQKVAVLPIFKT